MAKNLILPESYNSKDKLFQTEAQKQTTRYYEQLESKKKGELDVEGKKQELVAFFEYCLNHWRDNDADFLDYMWVQLQKLKDDMNPMDGYTRVRKAFKEAFKK